jgi:hypothetical protein
LEHSVHYDRLPDYFLAFDMCALHRFFPKACRTDITNMYDRAQKVFLSRECLTQRLGLSAAASGCREESSIKQVPVVAVHDMVCDAVSVKSLKQARRQLIYLAFCPELVLFCL